MWNAYGMCLINTMQKQNASFTLNKGEKLLKGIQYMWNIKA